MKFVVLRILFGAFFIWVGCDKILEPHQNFLYVIQAYQVFPEFVENIASWVMPWIEFLLGLFLLLGLWTQLILRVFIGLMASFMLIISQALIRQLPIKSCGCFGGLFSSDLRHTLLFDICLTMLLFVLIKQFNQTNRFSLDQYFSRCEKLS